MLENNDIVHQKLKGGASFIQLGKWRIGATDKDHFVFSSVSGYTSVIYRQDGTVHKGPRKDFTLWDRQANGIVNITFGNKFIQFNKVWRIAQIDTNHLSLAHLSKTCMIWRADGTKHPGPRDDFNGFQSNNNNANIEFEDNFLIIGNWHIGQYNPMHFVIGTSKKTADIYRSDGTIHNGPRQDFILQKK